MNTPASPTAAAGQGRAACRKPGAGALTRPGRRRPGFALARAGLVAAALGWADTAGGEPLDLKGRTMGTTWSVKWVPTTPTTAAAAAQLQVQLAARLEALEQIFSTYRPGSEVSRFNRTSGQDWFPVAPELAQVALRSRELSAATGGAFDVTVAPLLKLWGVGPHPPPASWPAAAAVAAARSRVAAERLAVRLDPPGLRKLAPGLAVDFSSIAKGFAVDEISDLLTQLGAPNHLVGIGGDLRAAGAGPAGEGWRVAIEDPESPPGAVARIVHLRDRALSTSGSYRNVHVIGGRRVGHLLDPRTGLPASPDLAAVSVLHESCAVSSALATGLFVQGAEAGLLLATRTNLAALFFVPAPTPPPSTRATPAFAALVSVN